MASATQPGIDGSADWVSALLGRRLGTRIARTASLLTLIFVVAIGGTSYTMVREQIARNARAAIEHEATLFADHVTAALTAVVTTMGPLARNALVLNSLMDSLTRQTSLVPFLQDLSTVNGIPLDIVLTEFEGGPVAGDEALARAHSDWHGRVLRDGGVFVAVRDGPRGAMLFVAEPVVYPVTPGPEGALLYQIALEDVLKIPAALGPRHAVALLQGEQVIVARDVADADSSPGPNTLHWRQPLQLPEMLQPLGLSVRVVAPDSLITDPLSRVFDLYVLFAAALIAVVVAMSVWAARLLTRPLRELESVALSVVDAESLEYRFPQRGSRETDQLGRAFNRMLGRLSTAYQDLEHHVNLERERSAELARQAQELARSNAELERFAYVASHDLQEPLRKVRAFGDLLKAELGPSLSADATDYLQRMLNASQRMQGLIEDLLAFSRTSSTKVRRVPTSLEAVAADVVQDFEIQLARSGGSIEFESLPTVLGDRVQLYQLLQNLVGNSLKYSRDGVAPRIRLSACRLPAADAEVAMYRITIEDNGIGFEPRYAERIFGVFQRLHSRHQYEGTGIGLAICRKIVENCGGRIEAIGRPGQGTTVHFSLPAAPAGAEPASPTGSLPATDLADGDEAAAVC